jgi:DNA-binding transcriptional LysR family regulator
MFGKTDMRYSLRQLEVFLEVARAESVRRAARSLAMSQSAASGSLGELERQFGVRLFDRVGKRLQLSEVGRGVRAQAQATLEQARELERTLAGQQAVGRLRIGATLTIGNYLTVPLMARFMRDNPGAEVTLAVANTEEIARQVANFEIDVGLVEGEVEHPDLAVTTWRDDELVVFCSSGHPCARKRRLADADLRAAAWIVRERGSGTRQTFDRAMHGLLPGLHIALSLQHTEAIKEAVAAGLGLGCVSRIALEEAFARGTLRPCRVPHRDFRRKFYFLLHRHKHRSAGIQRWLQLCQSGPSGAREPDCSRRARAKRADPPAPGPNAVSGRRGGPSGGKTTGR